MPRSFVLSFVLILMFSCKTNDDPSSICQGIIDFGIPSIFLIELVDSEGNNLVENGTYLEEQITARLNGAILSEDLINTTHTEMQNVITLFPVGNEGANQYLINLSETETDTLDFTLEFIEIERLSEGSLYCGTRSDLASVNYNQNEVDISSISLDSLSPITITVIKSTN